MCFGFFFSADIPLFQQFNSKDYAFKTCSLYCIKYQMYQSVCLYYILRFFRYLVQRRASAVLKAPLLLSHLISSSLVSSSL